MKQVILYGVGSVELRRDVEYFLDNNYEILGYSDTHYTYDSLDGARFFRPQELSQQVFDFIIPLFFSWEIIEEVRNFLLSLEIPAEKIVAPTMFLHRNAEKYQLDLVKDLQQNYHKEAGLIFGLSYSQRDLCIKRFSLPFYDCSWSSLDLYYNYRLFQYMKSNGMEGVTAALLLFPYYYFDYDMSLAPRQYENGRMFSLWRLDDWHHYHQVENGHDYIENYRMFGRKISDFYHLNRYEMQNWGIYSESDGAANLDKIWFCTHPNTVAENRALFISFLRDMSASNITPYLIIPPIYLNGLNAASRNAFTLKKDCFYSLIREIQSETENITIYDYADIFADRRDYFMDLTHLNSAGAMVFTDRIDKELLRGVDINVIF